MKYSLIYADPPWSYRDKANAGKRGAGHKYPTMGDLDIEAMGGWVYNLAADDCALAMWATFPRIDAALEVMASWGFKYKTVAFTWVKTTKTGKPFWGMGNWTRANAEVCLLGIRGRPKRVSAAVHSVITAPVREHSRKPDEARDRLVQLLGDVPRIELFARQRAPGWDAWGNQVPPEREAA